MDLATVVSGTFGDKSFTTGPVGSSASPPAEFLVGGGGRVNPQITDDDAGWHDLAFAIGLDSSPFFRRANAVGMAIAMICADVKARDIAKAGLGLWMNEGETWRKVKPGEHWLAQLMARRPNSFHSWTEFWRMVITHYELCQNAYILKRIQRDGTVTELLPLLPARVRVRVTDSGKMVYEVLAQNEFERAVLGDTHMFVPAEQMIHLRGRLLDGVVGLSSAVLGSPVFDILDAINQYQTRLFASDAKVPLAFETDQVFQGDQADAAFRRLKEQLAQRVRRLQADGAPLLLEAGLKAKQLAVSSKDATTVEAYNQQVLRVCGLMQTPPHKIFHFESIKYENQNASDNQYANDCLIPLAANIEEKFRNEMLLEAEWDTFYPEFDRVAMIAGDPKTMLAMAETGIKGLVTINELRERVFSLNPIPGGNVRLVPVNMSMVDDDGKVVLQGASGQMGGTPNGSEAPTPPAPAPARSVRAAPEVLPPERNNPDVVQIHRKEFTSIITGIKDAVVGALKSQPAPVVNVHPTMVVPKRRTVRDVERDANALVRRIVDTETDDERAAG